MLETSHGLDSGVLSFHRGISGIPEPHTSSQLGTAVDANNVDSLIERLASWAHALLGESELVAAREEFHALMGKVFPGDSFYDARTGYFLEHFLLERPISEEAGRRLGTRLTPLQLRLAYINRSRDPRSANERALFESLSSFRHSLYAVERIRADTLTVRDLLIPETMTIVAKSGQSWRAFERSTIFQGFVVRLAGGAQLGTGLVIHPPRVRQHVLGLIRAAKKQKNLEELPILARIARIHLRHLRHRHVDAREIYRSATP